MHVNSVDFKNLFKTYVKAIKRLVVPESGVTQAVLLENSSRPNVSYHIWTVYAGVLEMAQKVFEGGVNT